jgi:hypothetical protein
MAYRERDPRRSPPRYDRSRGNNRYDRSPPHKRRRDDHDRRDWYGLVFVFSLSLGTETVRDSRMTVAGKDVVLLGMEHFLRVTYVT